MVINVKYKPDRAGETPQMLLCGARQSITAGDGGDNVGAGADAG